MLLALVVRPLTTHLFRDGDGGPSLTLIVGGGGEKGGERGSGGGKGRGLVVVRFIDDAVDAVARRSVPGGCVVYVFDARNVLQGVSWFL